MNRKVETPPRVSAWPVLRRFLVIFLPLSALVGGILLVLYYSHAQTERANVAVHEVRTVSHQKAMMVVDFHTILTDLMVLSGHHELREMLESAGAGRRQALAEEFLIASQSKWLFDKVRLLDETGREVVRVDFNAGRPYIVPETQLQSKAHRSYFKESFRLGAGEVYVSPFELNIERGEIERPLKPMIRLGTPVFDRQGRKRGVVVLNYLAASLLDRVVGADAETPPRLALLNADGFWLKGPRSEDEWGFMYADGKTRTFGNAFPAAWRRISAAEVGQFRNADGMFTFATVYPLLQARKSSPRPGKIVGPSADRRDARAYYWKIVSHVSPAVLNAEARAFLGSLLPVFAVLVVLMATGSGFLARVSVSRRRAQVALRESEAHFRDLIEGSVTGILIHRDWKPLFLNQAYADILGYDSREEILAMESREPQVAPYERARLRGYQAARRTGEPAPSRYEYDAVRKDGSIITLENTVRSVTWEGQPTTQNIIIDITERKRAEAKIRLVAEAAPNAMVMSAQTGEIVLVNAQAEKLFGYERQELIGQPIEMLLPQRIRRQHVEHRARFRGESPGAAMAPKRKVTARRKDGSEFPGEINLSTIETHEGISILSAIVDITARKQAEEVLRRYEHIVSASSDFMAFVDRNYIYRAVNAAYLDAFQKSNEAVVGHSVAEILGTEVFETLIKPRMKQCLSGNRINYQHWMDLPVLGRRYLDIHYDPFRDAEGSVSGVVINVRDVTEAHNLSEQLSYQASHDALTGLVNRREFERRLQQALQMTRVEKTENALCYLDLDQFKVINDTCGHVAGDALLRQLGGVLQEHVRKRDTLARLGGDEFGVLLEHCSVQQAVRVVNVLRKAVAEFRFMWGDMSFNIGVSIGLVPVTEASESITAVLRTADTACYAAKDAGRNRIHVYQEDDAELARRYGEMQWVARINRALEQDRFHLVFQPIAALKHREGEHYELLIRMQDEAGQIVPAGAFLPAAERYDLSTKLDRWVITEAFDWLAGQPEHLESLHLCSINLSGHSLGDEEFLPFVVDKLDERRVPADKICFEITETVAIANLANATHFIEALKKLGCRFALDDFGTGLSSFAYLKNLAVDYLKIDGVFVKDIADDPIALAMVKSINEIGHVLGMQTVAEFVENAAILAKLREIGVDYAQGYGIGRPRPLTEMLLPRAANLSQ